VKSKKGVRKRRMKRKKMRPGRRSKLLAENELEREKKGRRK
jgi:hypothetical protein